MSTIEAVLWDMYIYDLFMTHLIYTENFMNKGIIKLQNRDTSKNVKRANIPIISQSYHMSNVESEGI